MCVYKVCIFIYIYIYIHIQIQNNMNIPMSQYSLSICRSMINGPIGRKVTWNFNKRPRSELFIAVSGLLTLKAWPRWVIGRRGPTFQGDFPTRKWLEKSFLHPHFAMICPDFWLRMHETGSLSVRASRVLCIRNVSRFKYVQMMFKWCSNALEFVKTFVGTCVGSPVVTCRHVMSPSPGHSRTPSRWAKCDS